MKPSEYERNVEREMNNTTTTRRLNGVILHKSYVILYVQGILNFPYL